VDLIRACAALNDAVLQEWKFMNPAENFPPNYLQTHHAPRTGQKKVRPCQVKKKEQYQISTKRLIFDYHWAVCIG
jgi:hypothetical protein